MGSPTQTTRVLAECWPLQGGLEVRVWHGMMVACHFGPLAAAHFCVTWSGAGHRGVGGRGELAPGHPGACSLAPEGACCSQAFVLPSVVGLMFFMALAALASAS